MDDISRWNNSVKYAETDDIEKYNAYLNRPLSETEVEAFLEVLRYKDTLYVERVKK